MTKSLPFETHHREFLSDPERAKAYLEVALEEYEQDQNSAVFLLALREVAQAQGGLGKVAEQARINRGHVYHALSHEGNLAVAGDPDPLESGRASADGQVYTWRRRCGR